MLKSKDEVKEAFCKYKALVENQHKIKVICTDNRLEYCGKEFEDDLGKSGIKRERRVVYTLQQNDVAKRMNRTLTEMARCMILQAGLSLQFWAEAINTAAYMRNWPPTRAFEDATPYDVVLRETNVKLQDFWLPGLCPK